MTGLVPALVLAIGGVLILAGFVWLAGCVRRRHAAGATMNIVDEIFHPADHQPRIEVRAQFERKAPIPSPGDPAWARRYGR